MPQVLAPSLNFTYWAGGVVFYQFGEMSDGDKGKVLYGMKRIEQVSCVKFREEETIDNRVVITKGGLCQSNVGKVWPLPNGMMTVTDDCLNNKEKLLGVLINTLGFDDENNRPDRDFYVTGSTALFKKNFQHNTFGIDYDYRSVTHVDSDSGLKAIYPNFTSDKKEMKELAEKYQELITESMGRSKDLSLGDRFKIRVAYNCYDTRY